MDKKKENHSRVSPIVRNGGRSIYIQNPIIKSKNIKIPIKENITADFIILSSFLFFPFVLLCVSLVFLCGYEKYFTTKVLKGPDSYLDHKGHEGFPEN